MMPLVALPNSGQNARLSVALPSDRAVTTFIWHGRVALK